MKKTVLILTMLFALHQFVSAQDAPKILPPSPQSQEFFKHFDFPANNPNGTINYSIPIYEVKSGSLSLPISISYVSGGSKRADLPGEIGYNWSLNAGGRISRTIYGKPDELRPFPATIPDMNNGQGDYATDYNFIGDVYLPTSNYDSEFDMYSYSFGNTSGKFIYKPYYDPITANYNPKAVTIPEKPHQIEFGSSTGPGVIVDDKGITYRYESLEQAGSGPNYGWVTAKLLNYVISADKKDTIRIEYQQMAPQLSISGGTMTQVKDNNTHSSLYGYLSPFYTIEQYTQSTNNYNVMTPQYIYFKGGKIIFTMNSAQDAIEYISIYDKKNTLIKQFQLVRTAGNLTELRFKDVNGTNVEKYAIEYYPHTRNEYQSDFLGYIKQDGWHVFKTGVHYYYNYREPIQNVLIFGSGDTNTANYAFNGYGSDGTAICSMLKKVTYPTGGTAEYSYETNAVKVGFDFVNTGGMRLSQVKLTDNNGNTHYKTYAYGIGDESGSGLSKMIYVDNLNGPNPSYMSYESRVFSSSGWLGAESYRKRVYTSSILPEVAEAADEATFYPTVTVYDGTPSSNTGKTVYNYNAPTNGSRYQINPYPSADWGDYSSSASEEAMATPSSNPRYHINEFHFWRSFPLESTIVYKNNGSGYDTVKTVVNNYNYVETQRLKGLHILRNLELGQYAEVPFQLHIPIFFYDNYYVTTGREDLLSTTETLYTSTGKFATTTSYEYNSNNQVSKLTQQESSGDTKITTYKYAADQGSVEPYSSMVIKNMIAPVIEEATYKNVLDPNNLLQSTRTDYSFWANDTVVTNGPNPIYPERVWTFKRGQLNTDLRLWYKSYGKYDGNVQEVYAKWPGPATSYIWGYNRQYPIAEARNARYKEIYHNNFEERTYFDPGFIVKDNTRARTGRYSGKMANTGSTERVILSDTTLTIIKENKTKKFRYSGWVYSTGPAAEIHLFGQVSGGALTWFDWIGTTEVNKWVYLEKEFTVPANTSALRLRLDNESTGNVWFDDLRIMPADAMMTTLTYDPLIGTTSTTDNQGITTYYEYDSYQRLMNVKDKDGKIVKHMDYQYKQ